MSELENLVARARELPASAREAFVRREGAARHLDEVQVTRALAELHNDATPEARDHDLPRASGHPECAAPGANAGIAVSLAGVAPAHGTAGNGTLDQLRSRGPSSSRYALTGEVGAGGMGKIYRVYDKALRCHLAMKVTLRNQPATLSRFLEEAQVTAQLDHPGIVPVHELGIDEHDRIYFTMKLVRGETLREIYRQHHENSTEWTITRVLGLILRVCEAMAFAHAKGVVHRDLKPANIMVGKFGEVYVMDFGLARVVSRQTAGNTPADPSDAGGPVRTDRSEETASAGDSDGAPYLTVDGDAVGTPCYMPPEQAEGRHESIGPPADVYAIGAMLYHLLAGDAPYLEGKRFLSGSDVLTQVIARPPTPIATLAPRAPPELLAIVQTAMARDIANRYPSMIELARDLRAYLEVRVVAAYRTGALAELRKWMERNPALASSAGLLALVLVAATAIVSRQKAVVAEQNKEISARKTEFDQLAGIVNLETALRSEVDLYPPWPERLADLKHWLATDARKVLAQKPIIERTIAELEARAIAQTDAERLADRSSHPKLFELNATRARAEWLQRRLTTSAQPGAGILPTLPADLSASTALELNGFASQRITMDFGRRILGEESAGLAAALECVRRIENGDDSGGPVDQSLAPAISTLGWAYFANGFDSAARDAMQRAQSLVASSSSARAAYSANTAELERSIEAHTGDAGAATLASLLKRVAELEGEVSRRSTWSFASESERFLHSALSKHRVELAEFEQLTTTRVEQRIAWASAIDELTQRHPNARVTWDDARAAIARADGIVASTLYSAVPIDLIPQIGLVPIGMNPRTKLWEFYDLRSGCDVATGADPRELPIPTHRDDGSIDMKDKTGIVFVLLPGGTFLQGAQKSDPKLANFDPTAQNDMTPQRVTLAPFFLARHEMTLAQWKRLTDDEPAAQMRGISYDGDTPIGWTHPVNQVDWLTAEKWLKRYGLDLPTEAQWEYAARAGTSTPWWTGATAASLVGAANVFDERAERAYPGLGRQSGNFDDGFVALSPVGTYRANAFGLFDVLGNVQEWCADRYVAKYGAPRLGDGLRGEDSSATDRVSRGASCNSHANRATCASRAWYGETIRFALLGVRPARKLQSN